MKSTSAMPDRIGELTSNRLILLRSALSLSLLPKRDSRKAKVWYRPR
jgi:hypothetical protein